MAPAAQVIAAQAGSAPLLQHVASGRSSFIRFGPGRLRDVADVGLNEARGAALRGQLGDQLLPGLGAPAGDDDGLRALPRPRCRICRPAPRSSKVDDKFIDLHVVPRWMHKGGVEPSKIHDYIIDQEPKQRQNLCLQILKLLLDFMRSWSK